MKISTRKTAKQTSPLKNWAIIYNSTKPATFEVAQRLGEILKNLGARSRLFKDTPKSLKGFDAAASIGGDGTLLGCVPAALAAQIPLVGINMGKMGYLTGISKEKIKSSFEKILKGKYIAVPRMVLKATMKDGTAHYGLNDLVIKSAEYRLAELKVSVDGELVTEFDCDGLIFATPTGTTAYNLSAGGPLLHIKADGIVMTPIAAHTLSNRSVIFNSRSTLKVEMGGELCSVHINVDGRTVTESRTCLPINIRQATRKLIILEDPKRGHFQTLREKLGWR